MSPATPAPTSHDDVNPERRQRAPKRWRRGALAVLALSMFGAALPFPSTPAHAVHDVGLFELDGNAVDQAPPGQDWDTVSVPPAAAKMFISDGPAADSTYFTGGQSKDINDIPDWKNADNSAPDKDEITNAYAAAYSADVTPNDNLNNPQTFVYFGLDRFDNSGDANAGFWLFQNPVSVDTATGKFIGEHKVGDILIVSEFTNGGSISTIKAFMWDPANPAAVNNLVMVENGVTCGTVANDDLCAIANTAPTPAPWPYLSKDNETDFPTAAFFEGGVNLSAIFGATVPCFSSFMAESRSSSQINAVLKDFALGGFQFCGFTVQKTGDLRSKIGDAVDYSIVITNNRMGTLYFQSINDTLVPGLTVPAACLVLDPGETCSVNYSRTVLASDPDPIPNTVTVVYNSAQNGTGTAFTETDNHSVNLFTPSVTVDKTGDTLSTVGDPVDYTFVVTNTSSLDSPDLVNGTIVDNVLGNLLDPANPFVTSSDCTATLAVGTSCTINATRTVLAGDADPLPNTVTVHYNPENFTNDITASDDHSVNLFQPSVLVNKTGPALSKVGDTVEYTIRVTNTSSSDTPTLLLDSIVDSLIPNLTIPASCNSLAPGAFCEFTASRVVQAGDPDPLVNIVTVKFHADGFSFDVAGTSSTDSHSTDLFVPSVKVEKGGPATAKVGDSVTYTFKVTNTSTAGSPALVLDSIADPLIGNLTIPAACNSLAVGVSCKFTAARTVLAGDPDPLVNTVTVHYHPLGFPNDITDTDTHRVDIVKYGSDPGDVEVGDPYGQDPGDVTPQTPYTPPTPTTPTVTPSVSDPGAVVSGESGESGTAPVVDPQQDAAPAPAPLGQLPRTGQGLDRLMEAGALLLILGALTVLVTRRRRTNQA